MDHVHSNSEPMEPTKVPNKAPNKAPLLFVNKHPSSTTLSRSTRNERFRIFSHVQSRRRQQGKQRGQPCEQHSPHSITDKEQRDPIDATKTFPELDPALFLLLTSYPANNGYDPFHCTVAATDSGTHALLHYAFAYSAKTTFLAETFAPPSVISSRVSMRHNDAMNERIRRCVDDSALMYSTLAYGSSCLAWTTGFADKEKTPEYFIGKALQAVGALLSKPGLEVDSWTVLCVYSLAITESWNSIPEMWARCQDRYNFALQSDTSAAVSASRTHLKAVFQLTEEAGGWSKIHPYVMESVILADKYAALADMTPPTIDPSVFDPGPTLKWAQADPWMEEAFPLLGQSLMQTPMPEPLRHVVEDVVGYIRIAHVCWLGRDVPPEVESWLFFRFQSLIYRLLLLHSLRPREDCVRFAILVFLLNNTGYHGSKVSARTTVPFLHAVLVTAAPSEKQFRDPLLFWCLCTGAMTIPSSEQVWFKGMVASTSPYLLPKRTQAAFERVLQTYIYLPDQQRTQLRAIIDEPSRGIEVLWNRSTLDPRHPEPRY